MLAHEATAPRLRTRATPACSGAQTLAHVLHGEGHTPDLAARGLRPLFGNVRRTNAASELAFIRAPPGVAPRGQHALRCRAPADWRGRGWREWITCCCHACSHASPLARSPVWPNAHLAVVPRAHAPELLGAFLGRLPCPAPSPLAPKASLFTANRSPETPTKDTPEPLVMMGSGVRVPPSAWAECPMTTGIPTGARGIRSRRARRRGVPFVHPSPPAGLGWTHNQLG
jgi:hypothetical protein